MTQLAEKPAESTALAKSPRKVFNDLVTSDSFKAQLAAALPRHLTADRFIRVLLTATMKTPKLLECTQASIFKCILDAAAMGLECDGRRAHLIPFNNNKAGTVDCQLIIDYKGLVELAMRAGGVSSIHADTVHVGEEFEADRGLVTKHKIDYSKPRGEAYAAYCIIRMKDGGEKTEVMGREEILAIKARSKSAGSGPWVTDPGEMWKKTVTRRAMKWVPLSPEFREHAEKDDEPLNVTNSARTGLAALVDGLSSAPALDAGALLIEDGKAEVVA